VSLNDFNILYFRLRFVVHLSLTWSVSICDNRDEMETAIISVVCVGIMLIGTLTTIMSSLAGGDYNQRVIKGDGGAGGEHKTN